MKLYIKQHIFSWGDRFTVYDEAGNDRFYVQGEIFSLFKKLRIYDLNGREVACIKERFALFEAQYTIFRGEREVADVFKEITFFKPKYTVEGLGWDVDGDFFDHDYAISQFGRPIASVSKKWFTLGDAYEIDTMHGVDEVNALAVVLVIDACLARSN